MAGLTTAHGRLQRDRMMRGELLCNTCGECQPLSMFYRNPQRSLGYQATCKTCIKARDIKRRFDISLDEYEVYLRTPCSICGEPSSVLDHCHNTGKVRDGLCSACNLVLGAMNDDPARLRAAADYLEKHNG